ncbi:MAG: hypothetical protein B6D61_10695 [Bacteroidetes bacterium 4484_249]|nr:MAG: hypothetical protein B6D61_10695 [Bacteroidetes bacterium 4484_249]
MRNLLLSAVISFALISSYAQNNMVHNQQVPRAGVFIKEVQKGFEVNNDILKSEPGYDSLNMSFQGNWPLGKANDLISSITGDTIFIAAGGGVMILDITDPSAPQLISEVRARAFVDRLYFDYATHQLYLAAYFSGFEIWDLTDITNPARLSRTPTDALPRGGIYAYNDYLYVITVSGGMLVYEITDPVNPVYVTTTSISGSAWNFYAKDNFIYIQTSSAIRLYDITIPSIPVLRDSYSGSPRAIYVKDGYGYISDQTGLVIIDVSDPDDFTFMGSLQIPGSCYDAVVINGFAYVANNWYEASGGPGGVYAIDVSDPSAPVQTDFYNDYFKAISGVNDNVTSINDAGYTTFDVSVSGQLELIQQTGLPGSLRDIAIKGNYAFTGSNGFRVFDITDKSIPQQVAFVDIDAGAVDISGNIAAYIPESMGSGNRLSIIDITDPESPYEMGHYNNMLLTQDAIIQGDYVYIGGWWDGFTILDISDPTNPSFTTKEFNWYEGATPGVEWCFVSDLDVEGDYLYLIDYKPFEDDDTKGLYIFDISDPENPAFVSRYEQQSQQSWRIKVHNNYVYLADAYGGIEVIDVFDPLAPQTVAYQELMDVAYNLDVSPFGYVYASCYILGGVQAINISDPENPAVEGYYYRSGLFALNVTADGNDIYIADGSSGFQIYNHDELITGLDENMQNVEGINTFPNPSTGIINLDVETASEVVVFDQGGRFVKKEKLNIGKTRINLSDLPNGIYFLKIKMTDGIQLQKIVIAK